MSVPVSETIILDGVVIVQMLSPGAEKTFDNLFAQHLRSSWVDIVWRRI